MSSELLNKFNWVTSEYGPIKGTGDWAEVGALGTSGGYDWTDFNVFYSPSARRYFWHGDGGCSCNSWSDGLTSDADFENGDRAALLRAWESFAKEHEYTIRTTDYLSGVETIRNFKEPK
ncbi:hypothetical protein [Arthrobacter sp. ISL-69]|uniref:DUF7574 domain-containing protein n=1 Tax=Arthrobacter sp. ISL-69 TaxID=2819113 RepID=UPI001BEA0E3E|nr:hypothetical protein [Arthrobacter sp. ISL-69]MBT2537260.1 hypothetical protein [Arthrobacter sp. ISL-69]